MVFSKPLKQGKQMQGAQKTKVFHPFDPKGVLQKGKKNDSIPTIRKHR